MFRALGCTNSDKLSGSPERPGIARARLLRYQASTHPYPALQRTALVPSTTQKLGGRTRLARARFDQRVYGHGTRKGPTASSLCSHVGRESSGWKWLGLQSPGATPGSRKFSSRRSVTVQVHHSWLTTPAAKRCSTSATGPGGPGWTTVGGDLGHRYRNTKVSRIRWAKRLLSRLAMLRVRPMRRRPAPLPSA